MLLDTRFSLFFIVFHTPKRWICWDSFEPKLEQKGTRWARKPRCWRMIGSPIFEALLLKPLVHGYVSHKPRLEWKVTAAVWWLLWDVFAIHVGVDVVLTQLENGMMGMKSFLSLVFASGPRRPAGAATRKTQEGKGARWKKERFGFKKLKTFEICASECTWSASSRTLRLAAMNELPRGLWVECLGETYFSGHASVESYWPRRFLETHWMPGRSRRRLRWT